MGVGIWRSGHRNGVRSVTGSRDAPLTREARPGVSRRRHTHNPPGVAEHLFHQRTSSVSCEATPPHHLLARPGDPEIREEFQLRRKMGIELEFYDATAVRARFPFLRPAALFSKVGGQVDPHRLTHGLLAAGKRAGLEVYDRTKMTRLEETRRGVRITTHNGCRITARRVVIAAGFESEPLLNAGAGTLKSTYALISEPLPKISGWHRQCLIWESGMPYLYLRTTTEGRIIVGGEDENFMNAKRRDALISQKARTLVKKFGRLFPDRPLEVAYAWAGTFGETKDGLPYIGVHPRFPHVCFALCYGGNGITFSVIAAEIIRNYFLGKENRDAHLIRFGR